MLIHILLLLVMRNIQEYMSQHILLLDVIMKFKAYDVVKEGILGGAPV